MITLSQLTKVFSEETRAAIDSLTAVIHPGRITGLVGPDGAGKTTLVRLIAGLIKPSSGTITVFGRDSVRDSAKIRETLGYMPQRFGLYEELSVMENMNLYAAMRGFGKQERAERFAELLRFTGLQQFTTRLARQLSGGMKQKLGLACALIKMPKLLLLDEPSVGVDPISRRELWRMVRELLADDVAVVWNTSYLDEAETCDDVLLMNEGKLLFHGKPHELTRRMKDRVVQIRGLPVAERRKKIAEWITLPEVLDGVIQGSALRIVLKPDVSAKILPVRKELIFPVAARFEDSFIDMLGGVPKEESVLAQRNIQLAKSDQPVVTAHGLTKRFGSFTAVRDNTFSIHRGEIYGLLGPNGAGKSTTFKMLCGLLRPTSGEGFIAGYNLRKSASKARSRLGYMAQKFSMYGDLTVRQNLMFFAGIYGLWGFAKRRAINEMLDIFDLGQYAATSAGLLPLGFKQRLSLAAALMHAPDVLFLDEPTSGVDPLTRREFWGHINALVGKGVTILVTTHFMDEAEYCDRINLIFRGETIAEGTPDELKTSVQSATLPDPTLDDAFAELIAKSKI
ncbi:MAG: ATP-binding cassette domain-containing protein [Planctomycetaceae bacterium]|jgi:ABC-2 type transport system ATP-binding protein|nr:ATP-binding cassette domain-containing protein [Planctomycetaceae bacterium]